MECLGVNLFLLILLAGLLHSVAAEEKTLDMSLNAVDDTFLNCREEMMDKVKSELLKTELKEGKDFADLWSVASKACSKQMDTITGNHLTALQAYANSQVTFRKEFNDLVQSKGNSTTDYEQEFPFKSLHFLLTDALRIINSGQQCYTVYYGTSNIYTATVGEEIRFGRFFNAKKKKSSEVEKIETEGEGTLFNISSCSVVNVEKYTCTSEHVEQLISPTEVFRVQNIRDVTNDDASYKVITLHHSRFLSNHDCYLFPKTSPGGSSSSLLSSTLLAVLASFLSLHYCIDTQ